MRVQPVGSIQITGTEKVPQEPINEVYSNAMNEKLKICKLTNSIVPIGEVELVPLEIKVTLELSSYRKLEELTMRKFHGKDCKAQCARFEHSWKQLSGKGDRVATVLKPSFNDCANRRHLTSMQAFQCSALEMEL